MNHLCLAYHFCSNKKLKFITSIQKRKGSHPDSTFQAKDYVLLDDYDMLSLSKNNFIEFTHFKRLNEH